MRVTDKMVFEAATDNVQRSRESLQSATAEVSSGMRVVQPGDDPAAAGLLAGSRINGARFDAINQAVGRASDELSAADGALGTLRNDLTRAREISVQMANGTYSATDRAGAATEVDGLVSSIVGALNTQVGNRYIFGGDKDTTAPFDASGNYSGDSAVRKVEVAPGVYQAVSVRADVAVKGAGGGTDVLGTLQSLSAALRANNPDAVAGQLSALDQSMQQINSATSDIGASENVLDTASAAQSAASALETKRGSALGDADIVDATSKLTLANQALQASISAASQSFQMTLLNKLG